MAQDNGIFSVRGKVVLVTGATGYLGRAVSRALVTAGAHVLVNGRSARRVNALVTQLRGEGGSADAVIFDVTNEEQMMSALSEYLRQPIHAVVNNAYFGGTGTVESAMAQAYRDSYEVCLVAAHCVLRTTLPALRRAVDLAGDASIINIASMYAHVSPNQAIYSTPCESNPPFYGAAKAALVQWTRYAACELGKEGIRVNSVSPGPFPADLVQRENPEFVARLSENVPLGRIGAAAEVTGPILFLVSQGSSFVNGTDLVVDGGWTAW